jgi:poly(glycerol-phosphate) alpha-glucosyltransferase
MFRLVIDKLRGVFIMKYTPIVFLHNIKKENGGLHRAIYQRVNAFSEYCDRVIIFTYGFDSEFWDLCNYHRSNGNINENVEIYNIYDGEFSDNNSNVFYYEKNKKYYYFQNTSDTYRVFNEVGQYIYYLVLNKYGIPKFKDHFVSPWNRYMKEVHDSQGYVRKKIFMDKNNIPAYEICYSKKNNPITSSVLTENGKKRKNFFWFPGQREFEMKYKWVWIAYMISFKILITRYYL